MIEFFLAQLLNFDTPKAEQLGALCEANNRAACAALVELTGGQCAAPVGSGCRYDSSVKYTLPVDNGLMVDVPNVGQSRYETVNFCLHESGVDKYQDLLTDTDVESFESCLIEMT